MKTETYAQVLVALTRGRHAFELKTVSIVRPTLVHRLSSVICAGIVSVRYAQDMTRVSVVSVEPMGTALA